MNTLKDVYNSLTRYVGGMIGLGVLIVFAYCFFIINFYPSGLTLSDSLIFIFASMAFGLMYSVGLFFSYFCMFTFISSAIEKKIADMTSFAMSVIFVLISIGMLYVLDADVDTIKAVLAFYGAGFILNIPYMVESKQPQSLIEEDDLEDSFGIFDSREKRRETASLVVILVGILSPILLSSLNGPFFLKKTLQMIGIRHENVSIILNPDNFKKITNISNSSLKPMVNCESPNSRLLTDVTLEWHGIGEKSKLRIPNTSSEQSFTVTLDSKGIDIIKDLDATEHKKCILVTGTTYFDTYSDKPNQYGMQQLDKFIANLNEKKKLKITNVEITGFSDRQIINNKEDSDFSLSRRRADNVYKVLEAKITLKKSNDIKVLGNNLPQGKVKCSPSLKGAELKYCLSKERVAEIKVTLE
jgi:flagellar motor protein MotB